MLEFFAGSNHLRDLSALFSPFGFFLLYSITSSIFIPFQTGSASISVLQNLLDGTVDGLGCGASVVCQLQGQINSWANTHQIRNVKL